MSLREDILRLEETARNLEPDAGGRRAFRDEVISYAEDFLNGIESINAFNISNTKGAELLSAPIGENGIGIEKAIDLLAHNVDKPGLNPASGGHLGWAMILAVG